MQFEASPHLPPLPTRRDFGWAAWLVIVIMVAFIAIRVQTNASQVGTNDNPMVALQLNLQARLAVGSKAAMAKAGKGLPPELAGKMDEFLQAMEKMAVSPEEKLDVAIIAGEIKGPDQALSRLDNLAKSSPSPELAKDLDTLRQIYAGTVGSLDAAAHAGFAERHGFFGQVALAYGVAADAEPRKSMEESALGLLLRVGFAGGIIFLVFLASVGLFIAAIVFVATGKIKRAYIPEPSANTAFLEGFALYLVAYIALGFLLHQFNVRTLAGSWLSLLIIPLVMYWTARRGVGRPQRSMAFGWHQGQGWLKEMALGMAGFLACLPFVFLGMLITIRLVSLTQAEPTHPIVGMLEGGFWHVMALYGLACGMAPVLEETMFRGALFHHLRRRWGWLVSAGTVSLLFAMIHPQGWTFIPALGSIAVVLALLREWRGSIIASMTAHALSNFIVLSLALLLLR